MTKAEFLRGEKAYLLYIDSLIDLQYIEYVEYMKSLKHLPFVEKSDLIYAAKVSLNRLVAARNEYAAILKQLKIK